MTHHSSESQESAWERHNAEWRDPAQIASQWRDAGETNPRLLAYTVYGAWWDILGRAGITLLITREYEHLVIALRGTERGPEVSFMPLPHPSGLAVDRQRGIVHIASTRNPNQVYDLQPVSGLLPRRDVHFGPLTEHPLVPVSSRFFPGCTYIHDLAMVGGVLYANAVGLNAVVRLEAGGQFQLAWWPQCIDTATGPAIDRNYLQLNSIAAGPTLEASYFSASTDRISARRPGHRNFAVDQRGVVFSGATRQPVARGLTRPHSARLFGDTLWVDNSGYGEVGIVDAKRFIPFARLPGWTRGLCIIDNTLFVGTSRVISRFRQYAPGLDERTSVCGLHAIDVASGEILGGLVWPSGNQIFAIDWVPTTLATGFPFTIKRERRADQTRVKAIFSAFHVQPPISQQQDGPLSARTCGGDLTTRPASTGSVPHVDDCERSHHHDS